MTKLADSAYLPRRLHKPPDICGMEPGFIMKVIVATMFDVDPFSDEATQLLTAIEARRKRSLIRQQRLGTRSKGGTAR